MALTLLQIVDRAYGEMALNAVPSTVAANTDLLVTQMFNLLNSTGSELVREHEWQRLSTEYRFTTVYYQYTADTTADSTTISSMSSTTGLTSTPTYFAVTGTGIPKDTYLVSVNSGASTAVLSNPATADGTAVTLTFSQVMYAMPSDFDRLTPDTEWDKTNRWTLMGPSTGQQWQWLKSSTIATGPRARYRMMGGLFQVFPPQASERLFGLEYIGRNWVIASGGTTPSKAAFTADTDTCIYDDTLMVETLKMRVRLEGGIPGGSYSPKDIARRFPLAILDKAKAADASAPMLSIAHRGIGYLISENNVQDGNFNV